MFVGVHERQLDDKGRLALPSAFRALLGDSCYLVFGDDRCVNVFAREDVRAHGPRRDGAGPPQRDDASTRQRALAHSATLVTLDKQGRVTVDEKLRTYARLEPELEGRSCPGTSTAPRCGARSSTTRAVGRGELPGRERAAPEEARGR